MIAALLRPKAEPPYHGHLPSAVRTVLPTDRAWRSPEVSAALRSGYTQADPGVDVAWL